MGGRQGLGGRRRAPCDKTSAWSLWSRSKTRKLLEKEVSHFRKSLLLVVAQPNPQKFRSRSSFHHYPIAVSKNEDQLAKSAPFALSYLAGMYLSQDLSPNSPTYRYAPQLNRTICPGIKQV